jgi:hypothetical protein
LRAVLETLAADLRACGEIDLSECFINGIFIVAKKRAASWQGHSGHIHAC